MLQTTWHRNVDRSSDGGMPYIRIPAFLQQHDVGSERASTSTTERASGLVLAHGLAFLSTLRLVSWIAAKGGLQATLSRDNSRDNDMFGLIGELSSSDTSLFGLSDHLRGLTLPSVPRPIAPALCSGQGRRGPRHTPAVGAGAQRLAGSAMGHHGRNPAASARKDHGGHVQPSGTQGTSLAARRRGHAQGPVADRGRQDSALRGAGGGGQHRGRTFLTAFHRLSPGPNRTLIRLRHITQYAGLGQRPGPVYPAATQPSELAPVNSIHDIHVPASRGVIKRCRNETTKSKKPRCGIRYSS